MSNLGKLKSNYPGLVPRTSTTMDPILLLGATFLRARGVGFTQVARNTAFCPWDDLACTALQIPVKALGRLHSSAYIGIHLETVTRASGEFFLPWYPSFVGVQRECVSRRSQNQETQHGVPFL